MDFLNTCYETTNSIRPLALYSHLLPAISILLLGFFALRFSKSLLKAKVFALFTVVLSLWLITDLVLWHSNNPYWFAMFWSFLDLLAIMFYLLLATFIYLDFSNNKFIPAWLTTVFLTILTIPFLLTVTGLTMEYFDEPNCEMAVNSLVISYNLYTAWFSILAILVMSIVKCYAVAFKRKEVVRVLVLALSSAFFLGIVSGAEQIANLTGVFEVILYSLFSLPIFILILTYSIIEQQTLDTNVSTFVYARLLFAIFVLVAGFSLFLSDDKFEFATFGVSTIVTFGFGYLLLRSARREMKQREEIEKLAYGLERANERLQILDKQKSEFVSIASHQLRSPLTAIRGYVSMMAEGSFGQLPEKAQEILERVNESSKFMATSINDFLDVSRIESGNMKYEYMDVNLKDQAEHVVDDLRADAVKRGLMLLYRSDMQGTGLVRADAGKTQQIFHNLINNALKYTPKGSVTVYAHDDVKSKKMYVDIIDTGVGLSSESMQKLFGKFARAKIASSANIMGTGLGLFVAREMARAMGGDITVQSEGEGKGSTFTISFPLV
ncbi:MAG: ATP-binding protein [Patescibacteria group bacterium]